MCLIYIELLDERSRGLFGYHGLAYLAGLQTRLSASTKDLVLFLSDSSSANRPRFRKINK